jgi:hypothetical protein
MIWLPLLRQHDSRFHQVRAREEPRYLLTAAGCHLRLADPLPAW